VNEKPHNPEWIEELEVPAGQVHNPEWRFAHRVLVGRRAWCRCSVAVRFVAHEALEWPRQRELARRKVEAALAKPCPQHGSARS
jgi:hypothetical protein